MVCSILDLPDEILLSIWSELDRTAVLYSFSGVHPTFDRLLCDWSYARHVRLVHHVSIGGDCSLTPVILQLFLSCTLPLLQHRIERLTVEPHTFERLVDVADYPQLSELVLVNFDQPAVWQRLTARSCFERIERLLFIKYEQQDPMPLTTINSNFYERLFSLFINLVELDFGDLRTGGSWPSSSCLVSLRINVFQMDDLLALLDGHFAQLRRLIVTVCGVESSAEVSHQSIIPLRLNYFSLNLETLRNDYDSSIFPLIRRMKNLEELRLFFSTDFPARIIDESDLNTEILRHLPNLQKFLFHIGSLSQSEVDLSKGPFGGVRQIFYNGISHDVAHYVSILRQTFCASHLYSFPSESNELILYDHHFPDGPFDHLRKLSLRQLFVPLEHEFFLRLAFHFPHITHLSTRIRGPQTGQRSSSSDDPNSIVKFLRLTDLALQGFHADYAEQFLVETNTWMPRLTHLHINYEDLIQVTENFTRAETRCNCLRIQHLVINRPMVQHSEFYHYFPSL